MPEHLIVRLLINPIDRSKAVIRYETKQLESSLERIVNLLEGGALWSVMPDKPSVMWLDAVFQSAVKSWRINAAKQLINFYKKESPRAATVKLDELFNAIDALQESAVCDKNSEDN
jgi:hypothetical protein